MRTAAAATRWFAAILLALYSLVIARLTLASASSESGIFGRLENVMYRVSDGRLVWRDTEIIANIALFIPAGFLLAVVVGRAWLSVVGCVLASAAIELAQQRWLPSRVPSIADVEHNSLGGVIGAVLGWPVAYWVRTTARRARGTMFPLVHAEQPKLSLTP